MAAESSRSTGPSPDSYIGSLISLTSKSEIRYEGILFNINTDEASIGLRNVRSFGTEGRRKDGPQVPPMDRVYEYIVFRGSDIKDLQVKSTPPVPAPSPIHSDPAIIQSHYPQTSASSISLPSATIGPVSDPSSQTSLPGPSRPAVQGGLPLYQPGGSLGSWSSSTPPQSNGSGFLVPTYWQGYYGPSSNLQNQQQAFLRPPQGLSMPGSLQQPVPYPIMAAPLQTASSSFPATKSLDFSTPLVPPIVSSSLNVQSTMLPVRSLQPASDAFTNSIPFKAPSLMSPAISQSSNLPLVPPLTTATDKSSGLSLVPPLATAADKSLESLLVPPLTTALDKSSGSSLVLDQAKQVSSPMVPCHSLSESVPTTVGISTSPSLVTPGQFLQPGSTGIPSFQTSQAAQKDVEVVQVSASVFQAPTVPSAAIVDTPASASRDSQGPLLPLPNSSQKLIGISSQYSHHHYTNRGARARGRGSEISRSASSFTEEFDFEAMNEKFNKDEVWGNLGKSKVNFEDEDLSYEEDSEFPNIEIKPVYKKDEFFDTLSCDALDNGSRNGRPRFSEQMRLDAETFGNYSRYRGGRGGRGGGRSRGGYYGRGHGYGYAGRGQGQNIYRPT